MFSSFSLLTYSLKTSQSVSLLPVTVVRGLLKKAPILQDEDGSSHNPGTQQGGETKGSSCSRGPPGSVGPPGIEVMSGPPVLT